MPATLPLFPLGTVLFPGLVLPLRVFEDRYRALVEDLLALPEGTPRRFGVVAIRRGHEVGDGRAEALYDVGCTAEVRRINPRDDGCYDVVTTGVTRFRLLGLDRGRPYLTARVEFLRESAGDASTAGALAGTVGEMYRDYLGLLADAQRSPIEVPDLPTDPALLSYVVAATMVLDLGDRQRLLAAADATDRLRFERALLRRETGLLRTLSAIPDVDLTRSAARPN